MQLWNTLNKEELEEKWRKKGYEWITISFYQYAKIPNPRLFRDHLYQMWSKLDVLGRVYVATEGVNAQISVPKENLESFKNATNSIEFLKDCLLYTSPSPRDS